MTLAPTILVKVRPEGEKGFRLTDRKITRLIYEDNETKADSLKLTVENQGLENFDDPVFEKGNILEVQWGYGANLSPPRKAVIQKVTGFQVITVHALSRSILMNRVQKVRNFFDVTRSDVAVAIAKENGFGSRLRDIENTKERFEVIAQVALTDAQLLKRLARKEGFEFYVDFAGFHWHQRRLGQRPTRTFRWFSPGTPGAEIISISVKNDVTAKPGKVVVKGRDPMNKTDLNATGSNEETQRDSLGAVIELVDPETGRTVLKERVAQEMVVSTAESSQDSAKREADGRYRRVQHTAIKLAVTAIGDPQVSAKSVVGIENIGRRLSGNYYARMVRHTVDGSSGYIMVMDLFSDGTQGHVSARPVAPSKGKQNKAKARDGDPDALEPFEAVDPETGDTRIEYRDSQGRTR